MRDTLEGLELFRKPGCYTAQGSDNLFKNPCIPATEANGTVPDFAAAMRAMTKLRPHVGVFFDKVTVNVDDIALRLFYGEWVAMWTFAAYWWLKSYELSKSNLEEAALKGQMPTRQLQ